VTGTVAAVDAATRARRSAPAVRAHDADLTYGELSERADALAGRLRALGVAAGDRVGLCLPRSAALVVGTLGIVRAGAAYVAIDPAYPEERMGGMLADSGSAALVTARDSARYPGFEGPVVALGPGGALDAPHGGLARPAAATTAAATPTAPPPGAGDAPAYVVYTSGSTGRPKGVLVTHAALDNLVAWHLDAFSVTSTDRCSQMSSPGFDAAVWEIWPCLAAGSCLHVVPDELRTDPGRLRDWLVERGITVAFVPTTVAETLLPLPWPAAADLRFLLTGGDALTRRPPPDLPFSLINNYGLSETAVVATSGVVDPVGDSPPDIGRPIRGAIAEVVDADLRPVAPGAVGELLVGGEVLAAGYLDPAAGAGRFVGTGAGRRYRTGDLVRCRPDGRLEFAGRVDDQVSIRGFRVEPGEVAAALNGHPSVAASAVVAVGDAGSERRLAAYLVARGAGGGDRPDAAELDRWVGRIVPEYMVPSAYVWLDRLPATAHGKLDREALPPPPPLGPTGIEPVGEPADEVEAAISAVVAELLGVERVGPHDNFFLLGGHSMLGAQLIMRVEDLYGVELSLRRLFDHPTVADIAAEVARQHAAGVVEGEGA